MTDGVWRQSGEVLQFNQVSHADYSTRSPSTTPTDGAARAVQTISLHDLLTTCKAPSRVDDLSIDTEGSEFDILSAPDFDRWSLAAR